MSLARNVSAVDTKADALRRRAWLAYHSLPRVGRDGQGPSRRALETAYRLDNGTFTKLFSGRLKRPGPGKCQAIASALNASYEWLWLGQGQAPPAPPWPVPELPPAADEGETLEITDDTRNGQVRVSSIPSPRQSKKRKQG